MFWPVRVGAMCACSRACRCSARRRAGRNRTDSSRGQRALTLAEIGLTGGLGCGLLRACACPSSTTPRFPPPATRPRMPGCPRLPLARCHPPPEQGPRTPGAGPPSLWPRPTRGRIARPHLHNARRRTTGRESGAGRGSRGEGKERAHAREKARGQSGEDPRRMRGDTPRAGPLPQRRELVQSRQTPPIIVFLPRIYPPFPEIYYPLRRIPIRNFHISNPRWSSSIHPNSFLNRPACPESSPNCRRAMGGITWAGSFLTNGTRQ